MYFCVGTSVNSKDEGLNQPTKHEKSEETKNKLALGFYSCFVDVSCLKAQKDVFTESFDTLLTNQLIQELKFEDLSNPLWRSDENSIQLSSNSLIMAVHGYFQSGLLGLAICDATMDAKLHKFKFTFKAAKQVDLMMTSKLDRFWVDAWNETANDEAIVFLSLADKSLRTFYINFLSTVEEQSVVAVPNPLEGKEIGNVLMAIQPSCDLRRLFRAYIVDSGRLKLEVYQMDDTLKDSLPISYSKRTTLVLSTSDGEILNNPTSISFQRAAFSPIIRYSLCVGFENERHLLFDVQETHQLTSCCSFGMKTLPELLQGFGYEGLEMKNLRPSCPKYGPTLHVAVVNPNGKTISSSKKQMTLLIKISLIT